MSLLMHHSKTAPLAPSIVSEEPIPAGLDAIVLDCLSKEPDLRPKSADILWERLDTVPVASQWNQGRAREWWELHQPDLLKQP